MVSKTLYLEEKVALAGGGMQAKLAAPKAWVRLRAGPAALAQARRGVGGKEKVRAYHSRPWRVLSRMLGTFGDMELLFFCL